ncbi:hypothetical protein ZWY2020_006323 [Hordeum vulgare]|nr:hypothetical protein ZWY2020_006323 [Hordeum vulgare]
MPTGHRAPEQPAADTDDHQADLRSLLLSPIRLLLPLSFFLSLPFAGTGSTPSMPHQAPPLLDFVACAAGSAPSAGAPLTLSPRHALLYHVAFSRGCVRPTIGGLLPAGFGADLTATSVPLTGPCSCTHSTSWPV